MEWGEHLAFLEDLKKKGKDPEALKTKPKISWSLLHFISDYQTISGFRSSGFSGPNPIDIPSIFIYSQLMGVENPQRFLRVMKKLDTIYLRKSYDSADTGSKGNRPRGSKTSRH